MWQTQPTVHGSFRLFRVAGISVFMHWSWLVVALFEMQARAHVYRMQIWNLAEYLTLFLIVLLHEFGHVLACRQVGGRANEIVLWPLGGIAFISPPPRPGAVLWSIAAGPLVNVALVPLTLGAAIMAVFFQQLDVKNFLTMPATINLLLLISNMLPIYPLDGGQILQALLWFVIGRVRSLMVVSVIGMAAGAGVLVLAIVATEFWIGMLALFMAYRSWMGFHQARFLAAMLKAPRHKNAFCPGCGDAPIMGNFWTCDQCGTRFDIFDHQGICPGCDRYFSATACPNCGQQNPLAEWYPRKPEIPPSAVDPASSPLG
jgi:Zn-dependent protease/ribosomal protein S27AE